MKILGIDLAGSEKNDTGLCLLDDREGKKVLIKLVKTDDEILSYIKETQPDVVAIDAPLSNAKNGYMRKADEALRELGSLPLNLRGMTYLVNRGIRMGRLIKHYARTIEVFNTASAKILGVYSRDDNEMQKSLLNMEISGDIEKRMLTRDELDAIVSAITGYLHLKGKSKAVGDEEEGWIIVPEV